MSTEDDRRLIEHLVFEMRDANRAMMAYHDAYGAQIGRLVGQDALVSLREMVGQPMDQCGWCRESFYELCISGLCAVCEVNRKHIMSLGEPGGAEDGRHLRLVD